MTNWCNNNLKVVGDKLPLHIFDMVSQQEHILLGKPLTEINDTVINTLRFFKNSPPILTFTLNKPFYFSSIVAPLDPIAKIVLDRNQSPTSQLISEILSHPQFKVTPEDKTDFHKIYWGTKWEAQNAEYIQISPTQSEYTFESASSHPDDWLRACSLVFRDLTFINSSMESSNEFLSLSVHQKGESTELIKEDFVMKNHKQYTFFDNNGTEYTDYGKMYNLVAIKKSKKIAKDVLIPNKNDNIYEELTNYNHLSLNKLIHLSNQINVIIDSPIQHQFTVVDILMNHLISKHSDKQWALNHLEQLSQEGYFLKDVLLFSKTDILNYAIHNNLTNVAEILIKSPHYHKKLSSYAGNFITTIANDENLFYEQTTNFILEKIGNPFKLPPTIENQDVIYYVQLALLLDKAKQNTNAITSLIEPHMDYLNKTLNTPDLNKYMSLYEKNVLSSDNINSTSPKGLKI